MLKIILSVAAGALASFIFWRWRCIKRRISGISGVAGRLADTVQSTVRELAREKEQLSAILSSMVEGVIAVDRQRRVLMINPATESLFDVSNDDARGRLFLEVLRDSHLDMILRLTLDKRRAHTDEMKLFVPEERTFEAHAVPILEARNDRNDRNDSNEHNGKKEVTGALLVLHDITRLRQLEQMQRDFVANVSHELRTPVASIKGYAETLRSGAINDSQNRLNFVETIEKHADRLARLIDDLLDLTAMDSGKRTTNPESIDIKELVLDTVKILEPLAKRAGVSVTVSFPDDLPRAYADRHQLRQVLTNLLDNAIKFNKDKGTIEVAGNVQSKNIRVTVKDTGIGIPDAELPRIFERFYRVDKARSRELGGTGLGLSIVKRIVENNKGTAGVASKFGEGSTFWFTVPVAVPPPL